MADGESGAKALNASRINSTGGLDLAPEIAAALSECVSSTKLSWPALGYESKNALKLLATGSAGGYAALKPHLADDAVVYSAFKVACAGSQRVLIVGIQVVDSENLKSHAIAAKLTKALGAPVTL
jgi:hypothetical protein